MAHEHTVTDGDLSFSISATTREIMNPNVEKRKFIQYDHNSERLTFEMPRFIDGHDMLSCTKIEIHFINIANNKTDKSEGVYEVDDVQKSATFDNLITFSWLISQNATMYAGSLNFLIRFTCLSGAVIDYAWNTEIFSGITVSNGMNNGEAVVEEYSDVLEAWRQELLNSAPTAKVEQTEDGAVITVTDKNGTTTATISGGGGGEMEVLWENANLSYEFSQQSIPLGDTNYRKFLVQFLPVCTYAMEGVNQGDVVYCYINIDDDLGEYGYDAYDEETGEWYTAYAKSDWGVCASCFSGSYEEFLSRRFQYGDFGGKRLVIENCYRLAVGGTKTVNDNSCMIPVRIYGIA